MCTLKAQTLKGVYIQQENSERKNNNQKDAGVSETDMYHTTQLQFEWQNFSDNWVTNILCHAAPALPHVKTSL